MGLLRELGDIGAMVDVYRRAKAANDTADLRPYPNLAAVDLD